MENLNTSMAAEMEALCNGDVKDPLDPRNLPMAGAPRQLVEAPVRNPDEYHLDELVGPPPQSAESQKNPPPVKWEPDVLNPRHREILRRIIEGATYVQIAEAMGIHKQTVMLVATSPLFRAELAKLEKQLDYNIVQRADSMANEALDKIKTLMRTGRSEFIQARMAERILDTAGYSKVERRIVGIVTGEDVIRELNKRKRQAATADGGSTVSTNDLGDREIGDFGRP